jgi:hypothetical protein
MRKRKSNHVRDFIFNIANRLSYNDEGCCDSLSLNLTSTA